MMLMLYLSLIDDPSDRDLFCSLYDQYRLQMMHMANTILHDQGLAEDAVHNAFLKIAKNMQRFDFSRDASALLLTITKNCAKTIRDKEKREWVALSEPDAFTSKYDTTNIEENYENKEMIERIAQVIADLPEEYSTIFSLRFRYNMKSREIAEIVGLSDDVVRKRIQRLKKIIYEIGQEQGE